MKSCKRCGVAKESIEFPIARGTRRRAECRTCWNALMRPRSQMHYRKNKKTYRQRVLRRQKQIKAMILAFKLACPVCTDCKLAHPPWRLDFDHLPGYKKTCDVSMIYLRGWADERVMQEIDKCQIVCANCHRDRTHQRRITAQAAAC